MERDSEDKSPRTHFALMVVSPTQTTLALLYCFPLQGFLPNGLLKQAEMFHLKIAIYAQLYLTFCDLMHCTCQAPQFMVFVQARILERVAISCSRGSF